MSHLKIFYIFKQNFLLYLFNEEYTVLKVIVIGNSNSYFYSKMLASVKNNSHSYNSVAKTF